MTRTLFTSFLAFCLVLPSARGVAQTPETRPELVAVMDVALGEGVPAAVQHPFTDRVLNTLAGLDRFRVVDRAHRDEVLAEQGFQQSDCVDESCRVEAGRLLGVRFLVTGRISALGQKTFFSLQRINVETGALAGSVTAECQCALEEIPAEAEALTERLFEGTDAADGGVTNSWWFWTLLGVVAVGAGTAAAVVATSGSDEEVRGARYRIQVAP